MSNQRVIIIGAGLGGLVCGAILSKEGMDVTIVEKNPRIGGCLQSYQRNGSVFDTGMHIFGGMHEGGNIRRIFDYLGITGSLNIQNLGTPEDIEVYVKEEGNLYTLALNRTGFTDSFAKSFPEERANLREYQEKVDKVMNQMDLFHLCPNHGLNLAADPDFLLPANQFISKYIPNPKLRGLLAAINVLYAGEANVTPAFLHSSIASIFFNGACRIAGGYETLAQALMAVITDNGGRVFLNSKVDSINTENGAAISVSTNGETIKGDLFIMASPTNELNNLLDDTQILSKSYKSFLASKKDSVSSFIVNIRLKKDRIKYSNRIGFYLEDYEQVWDEGDGTKLNRFLYMTPPLPIQGEYAETLNIVAPMKWSTVSEWKNSAQGSRGEEYAKFKRAIVDSVIEKLSKVYPNLSESIEYVDSATPLTIRNFTGVRHGAMCGLRKDCNSPLPFIPLRTKVPNLFLTGQSVNMHGFCGVTLTAVQTCEAILGQDYLINKLN